MSRISVILLLTSASLQLTVCAMAQDSLSAQAAHLRHSVKLESAKWPKNDGEYRKMRSSIDAALTRKIDGKALISHYRKQYLDALFARQKDRFVLGFAWLYAAYRAEHMTNKLWTPELVEAYSKVQSDEIPAVYDYVRLRFILRQRHVPDKSMRSLGEKLLLANQNDYEVKYHYIGLLDPDVSLRDRAIAIKYVEDLRRLRPDYFPTYSKIGGTYYIIWLGTRKREDAAQAISGYKTYLRLAPADRPFRKDAQRFIGELSKAK